MLSPLREPVYAASARTVSGSLAEMERIIGDALFAGYVGYNGRAPGSAVKKEEDMVDAGERNKSGGDARHTLVAYFEIVELASILCVDRETTNLAIRTFRHTANNTSLRNRNVESLATAAFVSAAERRWHEYQEWLKMRDGTLLSPEDAQDGGSLKGQESGQDYVSGKEQEAEQDAASVKEKEALRYSASLTEQEAGQDTASLKEQESGPDAFSLKELEAAQDTDLLIDKWPNPPRRLTVEEISAAASLDVREVVRNLKVVNVALRKQRPENSSSISTHMPTFCRRLELPDSTKKLAIAIAENAIQNSVCSRRNQGSISAAAIYLACQMDEIRKTQAEICRATTVTEVTLRKVHKELISKRDEIVPDWYVPNEKKEDGADGDRQSSLHVSRQSSQEEARSATVNASMEIAAADGSGSMDVKQEDGLYLAPPPLPPGFEERLATEKEEEQKGKVTVDPLNPSQPIPTPTTNPMMAMLNHPAMQAFASAFSMMPPMMPPPPPPLPTSGHTAPANDMVHPKAKPEGKEMDDATNSKPDGSTDKMEVVSENQRPTSGSTAIPMPAMPPIPPPPPIPAASSETKDNTVSKPVPPAAGNLMAGMQSMMGMVQALQAFQAVQMQASSSQGAGQSVEQMNPFAMMAMAMAQAQTINNGAVEPVTQQAVPESSIGTSDAAPPEKANNNASNQSSQDHDEGGSSSR